MTFGVASAGDAESRCSTVSAGPASPRLSGEPKDSERQRGTGERGPADWTHYDSGPLLSALTDKAARDDLMLRRTSSAEISGSPYIRVCSLRLVVALMHEVRSQVDEMRRR